MTLTEESNEGLSSTISADVIAYKKVCDELSALREELTVAKQEIESSTGNEVSAIEALTAAEQRNAELLDLLRGIKDAPGSSQFRKHIEAVLIKPTESGVYK